MYRLTSKSTDHPLIYGGCSTLCFITLFVRLEAFAMWKSLFSFDPLSHTSITILTDSLSLISSLEMEGLHSRAHELVCLIRQRIMELLELRFCVLLHWVPSHKGIKGNDRVDFLAKQWGNSNYFIWSGNVPTTTETASLFVPKVCLESDVGLLVFSNKDTIAILVDFIISKKISL